MKPQDGSENTYSPPKGAGLAYNQKAAGPSTGDNHRAGQPILKMQAPKYELNIIGGICGDALQKLLIGRDINEVAQLLTRIFNLCPKAQQLAAQMALGLRITVSHDQILAEIQKDHLVKLCFTLPPLLGLSPHPQAPMIFSNISADCDKTYYSIFEQDPLPESLDELQKWAWENNSWSAKLTTALIGRLGRLNDEIGVLIPSMPFVLSQNTLSHQNWENSAAARASQYPLMANIEKHQGRSPLWRLWGMLLDLKSALYGDIAPARMSHEAALVPAARGLYALRIKHEKNRAVKIERKTPTDHLLMPKSALHIALEQLQRAQKQELFDLIIAIHDPCCSITLKEDVQNKGAQNA